MVRNDDSKFLFFFAKYILDCVWNVMAHAQKPDFLFRRNGRVHLNRLGASVQSTTGSRGVRISGSNAGYTTFRSSVKGTGYLFHSPVSPSLPLPCVTVCHHISTGLYLPLQYLYLKCYENTKRTLAFIYLTFLSCQFFHNYSTRSIYRPLLMVELTGLLFWKPSTDFCW